MRRKFRHDNAFKFSYRDAETAFPFPVLPVGEVRQVPTATPPDMNLGRVWSGMSGLFGPVGSTCPSRVRPEAAVAIRNEPVILRRQRSAKVRVYAPASRTPSNTAIVAMTADSALRANLAQERPVPSLEELNDGDKIEVVRREIASQIDRSVQGPGGAK